jgi:CCR4-NOT transcription complex subunit 1
MSDAPMASSPLAGFGSIVFAQLRYLVQNINKKNQKASSTEISHLLWLYGESSFVHLIVCLLEEIDFRDPKLQKDLLKAQLLTQEFAKLAARPNFVTLFCEIIAKAALPTPLQEDFLHAVAKAVKATNAQQLALGLGLAQCSDQAIRTEGSKFLRTRLNELTMPPNGGKEAVAALPDDLGHSLIFYLERQEGFAKQRVALLKLLQLCAPPTASACTASARKPHSPPPRSVPFGVPRSSPHPSCRPPSRALPPPPCPRPTRAQCTRRTRRRSRCCR